MNRLSNILSPLDTCHGDTKVWAIHETSLGPSPQGCGPSFRATVRSATPVARILTAVVLMVLVLLIGKWADSPMTDYYNGEQVMR